MKYLLTVLTLFIYIKSAAQYGTPIYSHDNLKTRNFIQLYDNNKLIIEVQSGTKPLKVMLMNHENLIVDTLAIGSVCYFYHPLANNTIIGEGHKSTMLLQVENEKLILKNNISNCPSENHGYAVQFNQKVISFFVTQLKKGKKRYELVAMPEIDDSIECFSREGGDLLFMKEEKSSINRKLLTSLPVTYGISDNSLNVFIRDLQSLQSYTKEFILTEFKLPYDEDWVWSYFFDSFSTKDYFVKKTKDKIQLFVINKNKLIFIQELQQTPEQIFNNQLIVCKGNSDKNCDYFAKPIKIIN